MAIVKAKDIVFRMVETNGGLPVGFFVFNKKTGEEYFRQAAVLNNFAAAYSRAASQCRIIRQEETR